MMARSCNGGEDYLMNRDSVRQPMSKELDGIVDRNTGLGQVIENVEQNGEVGRELAGGDPDVNTYQAQVVGEEAIGGLTPTPDQNNVDQIGEAVGVEWSDLEPLQMTAELDERDEHRWELDSDLADL